MKKALLALSIIVANFTSSGQAIIPFIGGNYSAYTVKESNYTFKALPGWNLGGIGEIDLSSRFSLQPGLQYCFIGGQLTNSEPGFSLREHDSSVYRVHSLQIPVMLTIKMGHEGRGQFFAGAGLYGTLNLWGKLAGKRVTINRVGYDVDHYESDLTIWPREADHVRRFDFGLNAGVGYRSFEGLELFAFFQRGVVDILAEYDKPAAYSYQ